MIGRGHSPYQPQWYNGLIDEVRVSNTVLYTANFTPQTHLTASGSTKGLWKFDGSTPNDSSGNANNGTLNGGATYSIDAPSGGGGGGAAQIRWLVTDQLGTPRMIFDQTGSLANVSRHDYLAFGEELFAGTGGRTTAQGYVGDNVRQKFTDKERDAETGLDYFGARYYASNQGRFTTADPLLSSGDADIPQSWNRYSYTLNNPLIYTDPLGLYTFDKSVTDPQREEFRKNLSKARNDLWKIAAKYGVKSKEYKAAQRALNVYGDEGVKNGVTIATAKQKDAGLTYVSGTAGAKTKDNPTGQNITVTISDKEYEEGLWQIIGHEGSHAADGHDWVASGFSESKHPMWYNTEVDAYTVSSLLIEAEAPHNRLLNYSLPQASTGKGRAPYPTEEITLYSESWKEVDKATIRRRNIDAYLSRPIKAGGRYELNPASTAKVWRKGVP